MHTRVIIHKKTLNSMKNEPKYNYRKVMGRHLLNDGHGAAIIVGAAEELLPGLGPGGPLLSCEGRQVLLTLLWLTGVIHYRLVQPEE